MIQGSQFAYLQIKDNVHHPFKLWNEGLRRKPPFIQKTALKIIHSQLPVNRASSKRASSSNKNKCLWKRGGKARYFSEIKPYHSLEITSRKTVSILAALSCHWRSFASSPNVESWTHSISLQQPTCRPNKVCIIRLILISIDWGKNWKWLTTSVDWWIPTSSNIDPNLQNRSKDFDKIIQVKFLHRSQSQKSKYFKKHLLRFPKCQLRKSSWRWSKSNQLNFHEQRKDFNRRLDR